MGEGSRKRLFLLPQRGSLKARKTEQGEKSTRVLSQRKKWGELRKGSNLEKELSQDMFWGGGKCTKIRARFAGKDEIKDTKGGDLKNRRKKQIILPKVNVQKKRG